MIKKAAILAAGEGSRIKHISEHKPMVKLLGKPMIERLIAQMKACGANQFTIAFNTAEKKMPFTTLAALGSQGINHFFVDTPSSMHTLYEVLKRANLSEGHILVSMVDTIIKEKDFINYCQHCQNIKEGESSILITSFIDDEKPLTVQVDGKGQVVGFDTAVESGSSVTSGMYYFSSDILPHLEKCINSGVFKMRNFLAVLLKSGHKINSFLVPKTVDIDRPEDVQAAENFLREDL